MPTRNCPGPPAHEWEYEPTGKRGRPPVYCPEHRAVREESSTHVERASGIEPSEGPERVEQEETSVATKRINPFIQKAESQAKMAKLREKKAEKAAERAKADEAALEEEYLSIDERIDEAKDRYSKFLQATKEVEYSLDTAEEFNKVWRRADEAQNTLIGLLSRKRNLEVLIERMTAPAIDGQSPARVERAVKDESPQMPERAIAVESLDTSERELNLGGVEMTDEMIAAFMAEELSGA